MFYNLRAWPQGYKTFLNSTEHELSISHKNLNTQEKKSFSCLKHSYVVLICLVNVKIVNNYCWHSKIYEPNK